MIDRRTVKLLLIEDDAEYVIPIRDSFEAARSTSRFEIGVATSLSDGLEKISAAAPDAVLLDLSLPDCQGLDTFLRLRAAHPGLPIVVLSGFDDENIALEAVRKGAQDYIVKKHLNGRLLVRTVLYAMERQRVRRKFDRLMKKLRAANLRLNRLAVLDPLTELLNRRGLERAIAANSVWARRDESSLAMLIDLDRFKDVNDTWGHAVGDSVLKAVSRHLALSLRGSDTIARVGGDEFIVLLPQTRVAEALRVAEKIRMGVAEASVVTPTGERASVTASIGVVPLDEAPSVDALLTKTHGVLNRSKMGGRNRVSFGAAENEARRASPSVAPVEAAREALRAGGKFRAVAQSVFEIEGRTEIAVEFFARSVIRGYEMPGDFFEIAAGSDLLAAVDLECFRTCLAATARFSHDIRRHINLFPSTLASTPVSRIVDAIARLGGRKGLFCVELSEQQIVGDPSYLIEPTAALRRAGILIALDDVGYGRSSLESLVMLEPDIVKIDRRCVHGLAGSDPAIRRLKRIAAAAAALGAEAIAEGVESAQDLDAMRELGIRYAQGRLFGAPDSIVLAVQ